VVVMVVMVMVMVMVVVMGLDIMVHVRMDAGSHWSTVIAQGVLVVVSMVVVGAMGTVIVAMVVVIIGTVIVMVTVIAVMVVTMAGHTMVMIIMMVVRIPTAQSMSASGELGAIELQVRRYARLTLTLFVEELGTDDVLGPAALRLRAIMVAVLVRQLIRDVEAIVTR